MKKTDEHADDVPDVLDLILRSVGIENSVPGAVALVG